MSLAINLSLLADPLACLLASVLPWYRLGILSFIMTSLSLYLIIVSLMSPNPPMVNENGGGWVIFTVMIPLRAVMAYTKTMVFFTLKKKCLTADIEQAFRWAGFVTQAGSLIGSLLLFFLLQFSDAFHPAKDR
jgi:hypothetical protein